MRYQCPGLAVSLLSLLSACADVKNQGENEDDVASNQTANPNYYITTASELGLKMPEDFLKIANIADEDLQPVVTVGNSQPVTMTRPAVEGGDWTGNIMVPENSLQTLTVKWIEKYPGGDLDLATFTTQVMVESAEIRYRVGSTVYESATFDDDNDGVDNLTERKNNTDPRQDPFAGIDVIIPRVSGDLVPIIDGAFVNYEPNDAVLTGEWSVAVQKDRHGIELSIGSVIEDPAGNGQASYFHHWAAMHDGTYIYIIAISDDEGRHINDSIENWQDDELEIYFDGNNSKLESTDGRSSYDGIDDYQIHLSLLEPVFNTANSSDSMFAESGAGVNSAPVPEDFVFAIGLEKGPRSPRGRQDIYEVRLKISDLGITIGQAFGFEVQLNDDDDGNFRDTKWGWYHEPGTADKTWYDASKMGTAVLAQ